MVAKLGLIKGISLVQSFRASKLFIIKTLISSDVVPSLVLGFLNFFVCSIGEQSEQVIAVNFAKLALNFFQIEADYFGCWKQNLMH